MLYICSSLLSISCPLEVLLGWVNAEISSTLPLEGFTESRFHFCASSWQLLRQLLSSNAQSPSKKLPSNVLYLCLCITTDTSGQIPTPVKDELQVPITFSETGQIPLFSLISVCDKSINHYFQLSFLPASSTGVVHRQCSMNKAGEWTRVPAMCQVLCEALCMHYHVRMLQCRQFSYHVSMRSVDISPTM